MAAVLASVTLFQARAGRVKRSGKDGAAFSVGRSIPNVGSAVRGRKRAIVSKAP